MLETLAMMTLMILVSGMAVDVTQSTTDMIARPLWRALTHGKLGSMPDSFMARPWRCSTCMSFWLEVCAAIAAGMLGMWSLTLTNVAILTAFAFSTCPFTFMVADTYILVADK